MAQMKPYENFLSLYPKTGTKYAYQAGLFRFLRWKYQLEAHGRRPTKEEMDFFMAAADRYAREVKKGTQDPVDDLERYATYLKEQYLSNGKSGKSAWISIVSVREFLSSLKVKLDPDDLKKIRRHKMPRNKAITRESLITREIIKKILSHMDLRGRALTLFLVASGCRIGEALQIEETDISWNSNPVKVTIRREITKTDEDRITFLTPEAAETLGEWLKVKGDYLATTSKRAATSRARGKGLGIEKSSEDVRIFPFRRTAAHDLWDRAVQKAGLFTRDKNSKWNAIRIHGLRKYFRSTLGLKVHHDIAEGLLGHQEGMDAIYARSHPEEMLAEYYLMACDDLTILTNGTGKFMESLKEKDERIAALEQNLEEIKARMDRDKVIDERIVQSEAYQKAIKAAIAEALAEMQKKI
jgi:integrase